MELFFKARSVVVIGASRNPSKVGHVILKNLLESCFQGKLFAVNPHASSILNVACYVSVAHLPQKVDLAVIAVPVVEALRVVEDCGKKNIKHIIIVTAGFGELGNHDDEIRLQVLAKKYNLEVIGPNVLGTLDVYSGVDTLFLPRLRLNRPKPGGISFACQSGAVGSAMLDLMAKEGYGCAKFISYGNATIVDESDLVEYLGDDKETKVICLYVEGVKNGRRFFDVCKRVSRKKPIVFLKGGVTAAGGKAAISHTAALAGSVEVYKAAMLQAGVVWADNLEDLFDFARVLEKAKKPLGRKVQVITNGGGYGILSADAVELNKLVLTSLQSRTVDSLKKVLPPLVVVSNPMDLIGDATTERYRVAMDACLSDKQVDMLLVILLYQTPLITSDVVDVVKEAFTNTKKPLFVVSTGGEFTDVHKRNLEEFGIPCFSLPERAVKAMKILVDYYNKD